MDAGNRTQICPSGPNFYHSGPNFYHFLKTNPLTLSSASVSPCLSYQALERSFPFRPPYPLFHVKVEGPGNILIGEAIVLELSFESALMALASFCQGPSRGSRLSETTQTVWQKALLRNEREREEDNDSRIGHLISPAIINPPHGNSSCNE